MMAADREEGEENLELVYSGKETVVRVCQSEKSDAESCRFPVIQNTNDSGN